MMFCFFARCEGACFGQFDEKNAKTAPGVFEVFCIFIEIWQHLYYNIME